MPKFKRIITPEYNIKIFGYGKKWYRMYDLFNIMPYFWDSDIKFDLFVQFVDKKIHPKVKSINYDWKVVDSTDSDSYNDNT
jgi:hypothetical protein